jgi:glycosyltransferase involved in cell wall biosynthesis
VLENLARQYDAGNYEIIVVDNASTDKTRDAVSEFAADHPEISIRLVENRTRNIPKSLNIGIKEARGEVIVRMDAHSIPSPNYVRRCVELLQNGRAGIVGVSLRLQPGADTLIARSIALAVSHPFGIGDAKFRWPDAPAQFVDTVPFGVFHKALWQNLSGFNEELLTNEDYDFNYRARKEGKKILLDASAHCDYFARATYRDLAAQDFRYGLWKAQMIKLHPRSIKLRQLVAPSFVASIIVLALLGLGWMPAWWLLLAITLLYAALAIICGAHLARRSGDMKLTLAVATATAFPVIHFSWGSGFLVSLVRSPRKH